MHKVSTNINGMVLRCVNGRACVFKLIAAVKLCTQFLYEMFKIYLFYLLCSLYNLFNNFYVIL